MTAPIEDGTPRCLNCRFGLVITGPALDPPPILCRRYPPTWTEDGCFYPEMDDDEWCGEWQGRHGSN